MDQDWWEKRGQEELINSSYKPLEVRRNEMDDKSNVQQPSAQEQGGKRVRQNPARREQGDEGRVTDARAVGGGRGVDILGGGPREGVRIEGEEPTLETSIEVGDDSLGADGRRQYRR